MSETLSSKIIKAEKVGGLITFDKIRVEDVKEFIKNLKFEFNFEMKEARMHEIVNELAGEDLI